MAARTLLVGLLVICTVTIAGISFFMHPPTAYTGVQLHYTGALIQREIVDVESGSPAYRAGLRSGDVIGCVSARDSYILLGKSAFIRADIGYNPGSAVSLCATGPSGTRDIRFVPETRPPAPSFYGNDVLAAFRLVGYALFLLCAAALVLGRPGLMTWLFFLYALAAAPNFSGFANFTVLPPPLYAAYASFARAAITVQFGLLMMFAALVPNDKSPAGWRTGLFRAGLAVTGALAVIGIARTIPSLVMTGTFVTATTSLASLAVLMTVAVRLAAMEREERARFGWAAFAISWAVILDFLRQSTVTTGALGSWLPQLLIVTPVALMYAILKRHVIDVRFAISRTVVYAIITTLVVGVIGAADWATSVYLHEARFAMALDAAVTIGIAFALNRVHRATERAVDFLLFRKKYEAESYIKRLAQTLPKAKSEETVHRALVYAPYEYFELVSAAVFKPTGTAYAVCAAAGSDEAPIAFDQDHDVVRFLLTERRALTLRDLPNRLAIPIFQADSLAGFVLYGIHRDGTALDPDEIETLERLCETAAQAYTLIENAQYRAMLQATGV